MHSPSQPLTALVVANVALFVVSLAMWIFPSGYHSSECPVCECVNPDELHSEDDFGDSFPDLPIPVAAPSPPISNLPHPVPVQPPTKAIPTVSVPPAATPAERFKVGPLKILKMKKMADYTTGDIAATVDYPPYRTDLDNDTCHSRYQPLIDLAGEHKAIVLMTVNWGTMKLNHSWSNGICNVAKYLPFVYHALDYKTFVALSNLSVPAFYDTDPIIAGRFVSEKLAFGPQGSYSWMTCGRLVTILGAMKCGLSVLLLGADVFHAQDPLPFFARSPGGGWIPPKELQTAATGKRSVADINVAFGGPLPCETNMTASCAADKPSDHPSHRMNGDYYFIHPTKSAIQYMKRAITLCRAIGIADQSAFANVLRIGFDDGSRPSLHCLDVCSFTNGATFHTWRKSKEPKKPLVSIHFNWQPRGDKTQLFNRYGFSQHECILQWRARFAAYAAANGLP